MSIIINYFLKMLIPVIITIPFFLLIRVILYIIKKEKKLDIKREILILIFLLYTASLLSLVLKKGSSGGINLIPFKVFFETYTEVFINNNLSYFLINFLGNIIMFIPIGILISLLWKMNNKKIILIGLIFFSLIEIIQLFLNRGTDIDDILLNVLGIYLGYIFFKKRK